MQCEQQTKRSTCPSCSHEYELDESFLFTTRRHCPACKHQYLEYSPEPKARELLTADENYVLIAGPIGSGKSTACCYRLLSEALDRMPVSANGKKCARFAVIRNTAEQLRDTTVKTWLREFASGFIGRYYPSYKEYHIKDDHHDVEVLFRPLDKPEDQQRVLSLDLTAAWINEAREIPLEIITAVKSRCGRYPEGQRQLGYWHGVILDTNMPDEESDLGKIMLDPPEDWRVIRQPGAFEAGAENLDNLPLGYYQQHISAAVNKRWVDVHVHAKFGVSLQGKPVYEASFERARHVAQYPLRAIKTAMSVIVIGMDFGRQPAAVLMQQTPLGCINVLDEVIGRNVGLEKFLEEQLKPFLYTNYPGFKFFISGDPGGWQRSQHTEVNAADIFRKAGFSAEQTDTNDVDRRIESVESKFALHNGILISPTCKMVIRGCESKYMYKTKKDGTHEEKVSKNEWSHPCEAMQYGVMGVEKAIGRMLRPRTVRPVRVVQCAI